VRRAEEPLRPAGKPELAKLVRAGLGITALCIGAKPGEPYSPPEWTDED
jgi:hypothetical protein